MEREAGRRPVDLVAAACSASDAGGGDFPLPLPALLVSPIHPIRATRRLLRNAASSKCRLVGLPPANLVVVLTPGERSSGLATPSREHVYDVENQCVIPALRE